MRRGLFAGESGLIAAVLLGLALAAGTATAKPLSEGGFLGVYTDELDIAMLEALHYDGEGVLVQDVVKESPADEAKIKPGDILVKFNDRTITSPRSLERALWRTDPGDKATVELWRDDKARTVTVTLADRPEPDPSTFFFQKGSWLGDSLNYEMPKVGYLGVNLDNLGDQLADYFGAKDGGVLIESVEKDSPADEAGFKAGDVITQIDKLPVEESGDVSKRIREHKKGDKVEITILRDKKEKKITATLGEKEGFYWSAESIEPMIRGFARALPQYRTRIHVPRFRVHVDTEGDDGNFYFQKDAD